MLELPLYTVEVPRVVRCIDDVGSMEGSQKWSMLLQPTDEGRNRARTIADKNQGDRRSGLTGLLLHGNGETGQGNNWRSIVPISRLWQRFERHSQLLLKECPLLLQGWQRCCG